MRVYFCRGKRSRLKGAFALASTKQDHGSYCPITAQLSELNCTQEHCMQFGRTQDFQSRATDDLENYATDPDMAWSDRKDTRKQYRLIEELGPYI